ncbi:Apolipoprotein A1/A4/E domain protein [compost metagenome]
MRAALLDAGEEANRTIETTLSDAEKRARELAEQMRGNISGSLTDVERLMGEASQRSDTAAKHLRETLRQSVEEAVGRFSGATDEIRRSAQDIRQELDATRSELKRGAFDLPEEAKESAAAMRRAVSEQIKALQEISQLVGRSSQQLEVAEAGQPKVSLAQSGPTAPIRPQQQITQQPAPAPVSAPATPRNDAYSAGVLRGSLPASKPAPAATPAARQADTSAPAGQGGWISDLLRGASRDETAGPAPARAPAARPAEPAQAPRTANGDNRNPRHMVESLNSLSVDIARAIDHDASVDLWRRYQRGERDVFTRRLYTLKGQQTFDDIKRKYDREPEFRTAVDRYISDFEKLLADVARTDRDRTVTQSYLTSDTGKVYTMLAHAAGRFG